MGKEGEGEMNENKERFADFCVPNKGCKALVVVT